MTDNQIPAPLSECLTILSARLDDKLSPSEKRELEQASARLKAIDDMRGELSEPQIWALESGKMMDELGEMRERAKKAEAINTRLVEAAEYARDALRDGGIFPIMGITWQRLDDALDALKK